MALVRPTTIVVCGALLLAACGVDDARVRVSRTTEVIGATTEALYAMPSSRWENPSDIPVCWDTPGYAKEKAWVKDTQEKTWEAATPAIRFTGWGTCKSTSRGIRITVRAHEEGPHVKDVGNRIDGVREGMVLDFDFTADEFFREQCTSSEARRERCIRSVAVHEFGHALGLLHEQDRPDTPQSCERNVPPEEPGAQAVGDWDLMSIMNYCYPNRESVFPVKLSEADIEGVRRLYPGDGEEEPTEEDEEPSTKTSAKRRASADDEDEEEDESPRRMSTPSAGCSTGAAPSTGAGALVPFVVALAGAVRRRRRAT